MFKKIWPRGQVLSFVFVFVWRSLINCQIFPETGSVRRESGSEPLILNVETGSNRKGTENFSLSFNHNKCSYDQNEVMHLKDLSARKTT
jgi:hypothetical protein